MNRILVVCLGNICRSPMAEAMLRAKLHNAGIEATVDSAGTGGWHAGEAPDPRTLDVLARHGIPRGTDARALTREDAERFDLFLCMDADNVSNSRRILGPAVADRVHLIRPDGGNVPDPYYGGVDGFDLVYTLLDRALDHWVAQVSTGR